MEIIENLQKLAPWAADQPIYTKIVLSILIAGIAALFLTIIWTTPSTKVKESIAAVNSLLQGCYKRAVYTRTHAQMSHDAMFISIQNCRKLVQNQIPNISNAEHNQRASNILAALEGIEREQKNKPWDFEKIDKYKLEALRGFKELARATGVPFSVPNELMEDAYFSQDEADAPPST